MRKLTLTLTAAALVLGAMTLQASAQSYGDCSQRCLKGKRCEAFNFYQFTRRCNLIEKPKEYSDDRGAEVGIKVQPAR